MIMKRLNQLAAIFSFSILTFWGCVDLPENIILPEWDVDLNVPLMNKLYSVFDVFKPESKYSVTSTLNNEDFYLVESEHYIANSQVTDYVKILSQSSIAQSFMLPANVPTQSIYVIFPEGIEIEHATFTSGLLAFSIENPTPAPITSTLVIPGIHKPDGSELIIERTVNSLGRDSIVYDLSNHEYILPPNQPLQNKNSLQIIPSASSTMNGAFSNVNFYGYDFKLSSVVGMLPRTSLGIKRTAAFIALNDVANYRGKFFIKEGSIKLKSEYLSYHQNNFDLEINNVKIIGKRNTGEESLLNRNDGQNIILQLSNGASDLTLDQTNSNLTEFFSFLPDSIIITAEYILNPLNNQIVKKVTSNDSIKFSVQFSTKSIFAIKQTNFIDTISINLNQNDRDRIRDGVEADINLELENAIPIDAYFKAVLTDQNYSHLFTLTRNQLGIDSIKFLGGKVNSLTGQIISPTISSNIIKLDASQIKLMADAYHIILSTTINTSNAGNENPNPPTVQVKSSDWLNLKCFGRIKYHVGGE
jgi:hypothetical protein